MEKLIKIAVFVRLLWNRADWAVITIIIKLLNRVCVSSVYCLLLTNYHLNWNKNVEVTDLLHSFFYEKRFEKLEQIRLSGAFGNVVWLTLTLHFDINIFNIFRPKIKWIISKMIVRNQHKLLHAGQYLPEMKQKRKDFQRIS